MSNLNHTLEVKIPFQNNRFAATAQQVMSVDPIIRPESFQVEYVVSEEDNGTLLAKFSAEDDKSLRVGVNSSLSSILTIIETMDELDTV
ncbi:EKC/KEOPS complex subunit Pcc1p [Monosporozyma servazzii]